MRVSSLSASQTLAGAISDKLALVNQLGEQVATGKKSRSYAGLDADVALVVGARGAVAREEAYAAAAGRTEASLDLYDTHIGMMHERAGELRTVLLSGAGTGESAGIKASLDQLFAQVRASLNSRDGEGATFATPDGRPGFPFNTVDDLAAAPGADVFVDGATRRIARLGDDRVMTVGITARDAGAAVVAAMHRLAGLNLSAPRLDAAQQVEIQAAIGELDTGLGELAAVRADNGRRQAEVGRLRDEGEGRVIMLEKIVSDAEDVDLAETSTRLIATKAALEASYAIFSRFSEMTLARYLA